jgi:hypothetical protein
LLCSIIFDRKFFPSLESLIDNINCGLLLLAICVDCNKKSNKKLVLQIRTKSNHKKQISSGINYECSSIMWAGCGFGHGYGYFVYICVRHFQNRKIMQIRVCVSRIIFTTGK